MRQQFGQPSDWMRANPGQNVLEPSERIQSVPLAGCDEAPQHSSGMTAIVAAEERPVVAADCDTADCALRGVIVDF